MAYLIGVMTFSCYICRARATVELRNRYNSSLGYYCRKHGERELKEIQYREKACQP